MDPLTHTATGLFLSRIGLKRWTPMATPILLLAANVPDIDIVSAMGGSLNYLQYHRHLTHALLLMPVMAILPVALVRLVSRKPVQWAGAFFAALIAVASHLLLDWDQRLRHPSFAAFLREVVAPGHHKRLRSVDLGLLFLLCILGPLIGRLVGSEITSGSGRQKNHGRGVRLAGAVISATL